MTEAAAPAVRLSHARVLKIALPVVISNATIPLLGVVDTAVVGQLGDPAPIGAVGLGAVILTSMYWAFGFLRMGTVGLAAQAIGAGDRAEVAALLTRVLLIGGGAGLILIALRAPIFGLAMWLSPASEEVESLVRAYLQVRIWSAPAAIAIYGITGWLIAQERTAAVLVLQLWQNGLNIALSIWFVIGLDMGVEGVALGTFLAEWSGLMLGLWLCRRAFGVPAWRDWARIFDKVKLWHMAAVNTDILIRSVLLLLAFSSFLFMGADFGDATLAANQVLIQFVYVTSYGMDGFAFAAEALVGKAMGARAQVALRRAAILTSLWGLGVCALMAVLLALAGGVFIDAMTTAEGVRAEARSYLPWIVVAVLAGWASWMLDGIFIGATRTRDMRNMMALSFAGYVALVLLLAPAYGNHGLWAALAGFFALRGVTLAVRYPALERAAG
ncbi:MATE family efflux transporter [Roseicyclus mahoneyensis]|uniref:MATE family multidrug resistance protein n=1 Tax=Roseicyclus mahoneyensis TaxID=164332 RepID=A0A316G5N6_9RHOB|nr:MATE family efflux transporter [Roseicyclus mahoneyensis]PWK56271.1 MATE family multidrug resistance protein [Roseicyclus mahoneyensis]